MIKTEIGDVAGFIWHHLDRVGETDYSTLKKEIMVKHSISEDFFMMAIGWLLRENNISITNDSKTFTNAKLKLR